MSAFLAIAVIHLIAVASPGPDFAIIVKQSLTTSRRTIYWTALGIALGMLVHVTYSLLGIGLLVSQSIVLFTTIKLLGAGYLFYIGIRTLLTKRHVPTTHAIATLKNDTTSPWSALRIGFLCNALNPKVTLFFLALFTQVIDQHTPLAVQISYGLYMTLQTFVWFALLGSIVSSAMVRKHTAAVQHWAEKCMGAVLIMLGLRVALAGRE